MNIKILFGVKRNVENRWLPEPGGREREKQSPTNKFWMRISIKNQIFKREKKVLLEKILHVTSIPPYFFFAEAFYKNII